MAKRPKTPVPCIHCAHDRLCGVEEIVPNPRNPNKHPKRQIELLAKIISHTGWRAPVVVSTRSGFIVKGHGRYEAAKLLRCAVPIDDQDYENEAQEWADMIADNRLAELAEIDDAELSALIKELDGKIDLELAGFDTDALKDLGVIEEGAVDAEAQIDKAAELQKKWKTARGQVWEMGDHRLMCGDSTSVEAVGLLTANEKADIVFTSPPYGVGADSAKLRDTYVRGAEKRKSFYGKHDDRPDKWKSLMDGWWSAARPVVSCVVCNVQLLAENKRDLIQWVFDRAGDLVDIAIWDKISAAPQMQAKILSNTFEFIFIFGGNGSRAIPFSNFQGTMQNIFRLSPRVKNDAAEVHSAVMPVEFPVWVLSELMPEAKSVLEPFSGSGTTLMACENLKRKCRAMEIDPAYVAVALQRWADATGKTPKLIHAT